MIRVSESDFGKLQNWVTFAYRYLFVTIANFRWLFVNKFDAKSSYFEVKSFFLMGFIAKNRLKTLPLDYFF